MTPDSAASESQSPPSAPVMDEGGLLNRSITSKLQQGEMSEIDRGRAKDNDVGAEEAARVAGAEAVEADSERLKVEKDVAELDARSAGSAAARDAHEALVQAEELADDAISASLDSGQFAEDAHRNSRFFHHDAAAVAEDGRKAESDVAKAAKDLAAIDQLYARVESDGKVVAADSSTDGVRK